MNTFEWDEQTPVTANNMNEMQNILNGNISEEVGNQYNLITDGNAVKTGRQIDGKDEWVKRFSFTTTVADTYSKFLGFTVSEVIITKIEGTEISTTNNWWDVNIGDTQGATTFAQNVRLYDSDNTIKLSSNGNFKNTYVNVYYIYKN